MKKIILAVMLMFTTPAFSQNFLDTQYGPEGIEVHLLKASVANKVLTVAFMLDNSTSQDLYGIMSLGVTEVAYTTADKKFPVLRDVKGQYLASTMTTKHNADGFIFVETADDENTFSLTKGQKQVGWVKFEAPADADWPIEVSLPGVSPFTINNPNN